MQAGPLALRLPDQLAAVVLIEVRRHGPSPSPLELSPAAGAREQLQGAQARQTRAVRMIVPPAVGGEAMAGVIDIERNVGVRLGDCLHHLGRDRRVVATEMS